jgi:hypothetical protein
MSCGLANRLSLYPRNIAVYNGFGVESPGSHWGQEPRHATAACVTCMCIATHDLRNKTGVTFGQSSFTRQRREKGQTKGRRGFLGARNPVLLFVYSLSLLCLVKDDCRSVTSALFGL